MDRHLKERMVGAVVLVAIANILIPEMLSGPRSTNDPVVAATNAHAPSSSEDSAKLKTYTIDLSKGSSAAPAQPSEEMPLSPGAAQRVKPEENGVTTPAPPPEESVPVVVKKEVAPKDSSAPSALPAETSPVTEPTSTKGSWAVQVGSFGVRSTSERIAGDLKRQGFSAFVVAFRSGNQTMYRVRVGQERDRASAEVLLRKLKVHHPTATLVPPT